MTRAAPVATGLDRLGPVLVGAAAAVAVGIATGPHGPGLTADSAVYLSTADALAHGRGFRVYGGVPLSDFPPGYPLLLGAWLETIGGRPGDAARAVNAASIFALVVLGGLVLREYVRRSALRVSGVILLAAASALVHAGVFAWSEALFAACVMASLFFLQRSLAHGRLADVALAGACASACGTVRLVGAAVVLAGLVALVVGARSAAQRPGLVKRCLVFVGVAAIAPAVWVASRIAITDSPLGVRKPPQANALENSHDAGVSIAHWFVPETLSRPTRLIGYALAAGALCAGAALWARGTPAPPRDPGAGLLLPALLAASLVGLMIVSGSLTETDPLDFRLLSGALPPTVVLVMGAIDRLLDRHAGRVATALAALVLMAWAGALLAADAPVLRQARKGEGYADIQWRESELASLLRQAPAGARIYSNQPDVVWLLSRRDARCPFPALARVRCGGLSVPSDQRDEVRTPALLAWFREPYDIPIRPGRATCRLTRVATPRDGMLFRVTGTGCGTA